MKDDFVNNCQQNRPLSFTVYRELVNKIAQPESQNRPPSITGPTPLSHSLFCKPLRLIGLTLCQQA